jgi:hypothetical protein
MTFGIYNLQILLYIRTKDKEFQRKMNENKILEMEFIVKEYIETAVIILYGNNIFLFLY